MKYLAARLGHGSGWTVKRFKRLDFSMLIDLQDRHAARPLVFLEEYEGHLTRAFRQTLKPDSNVLDLGANIGYFTLLAASLAPRGRVLSFEPDPENFAILSANIHINRLRDRVTAYPFAVGDKEGVLYVTDLGNYHNRGARFTSTNLDQLNKHIHGENPRFSEVPVKKLDDFLGNVSIDVIKIDIEGAEPFAFRGMANLIRKNRPKIFMEFAPSNLEIFAQINPMDFLTDILGLADYKIHIIQENAELLDCGRSVDRVTAFQTASGLHHLDLFLSLD